MTVEDQLNEVEEQIEALKAKRRDLYQQSLEAVEDDKACSDSIAHSMLGLDKMRRGLQYPIEIKGLAWDNNLEPVRTNVMNETGRWVKVRPCAKEYGNKTYLGIMLGGMALSMSASFNQETGLLHLRNGMHNPAMYVPEIKKVIFGCGSWWGYIDTPEDLKSISDADIDNVWYVRALKELEK